MITYGVRGVYILIGVALTLFCLCIVLAVMCYIIEWWVREDVKEEEERKKRGKK